MMGPALRSLLLLWGLASSLHAAQPAAQPNRSRSPAADVSACKLTGPRSVDFSVGFNSSPVKNAPSTGTMNALMIFVDFSDCPATETPQSLYDFFLPQAANWYRNASYGRLNLNVTADTTRFYRMPGRADSYHWTRGLTTAQHLSYIQDAMAAYNRTISPPVDVLWVIVTAKAKPITSSFTSSVEIRTRAGAYVAARATTFGTTLYASFGYKSMNHETGHAMGLPDLYPYSTGGGGQYVGGFDVMGDITGPGPDYFAWDKWRLGWLDDTQINCVTAPGSTKHALSALEKADGGSSGVKAVVVRRNATAALVAELRTKVGVDTALCATGVLLYTISTTVDSGKGPIRVVDATPGSGGCGRDELNDAPLSLKGTSSFTVPGWSVKVTLTEQTADSAVIQVDVS